MTRTALLATLLATTASAALADETRGLGAHEHGVGAFNIALEGPEVAMELEAPGADIVGFEHAAKSEEDRAAIEAAKARLADPLTLFVMPSAAGCALASAEVDLLAEGDGHDHGHDEEHAHDDHAHDEHGHDEEHGHDDDHAHEATHTEFHAEYRLTCSDIEALDRIDFAYFEAFPNARELEVQMIGPAGSAGFEVTRDEPSLSIPGSS